MTLLVLISFVYLIFAYQNYLNKKVKPDESSESKVPVDLSDQELSMPAEEKAESFEPHISMDSEIKAERLENLTKNEEQQLRNELSPSSQQISSTDSEDTKIKSLEENQSIDEEERTVSDIEDGLITPIGSQEVVNNSQIQESSQDEIVDLNFAGSTNLQEGEDLNQNKEFLEDKSNK